MPAQNHSRPLVDAFSIWCETQPLRIPGKGDLANAVRYALNRWPSFTLFLEDRPASPSTTMLPSGQLG